MLPELLVLFACLNQTGCQATSSLYYAQHPAIQEWTKLAEREVKSDLGPEATQFAGAVLGAVSGREANIKVYRNLYFGFKRDKQELMFKEEF